MRGAVGRAGSGREREAGADKVLSMGGEEVGWRAAGVGGQEERRLGAAGAAWDGKTEAGAAKVVLNGSAAARTTVRVK